MDCCFIPPKLYRCFARSIADLVFRLGRQAQLLQIIFVVLIFFGVFVLYTETLITWTKYEFVVAPPCIFILMLLLLLLLLLLLGRFINR